MWVGDAWVVRRVAYWADENRYSTANSLGKGRHGMPALTSVKYVRVPNPARVHIRSIPYPRLVQALRERARLEGGGYPVNIGRAAAGND